MADSTQPAPALKEIFNRKRFEHFADETAAVWPGFDRARFMALATEGLDELGIMQRMRQTATSLHETLPQDFSRALTILEQLAPRIGNSFAAIALSEFVALYGQDHFDRSMEALKFFTRFGSSEFAIRTFLAGEFERTLAVMRGWALDENEHVRRLASEGSRPRLPWSFQLKPLLADPSPTLPILEALKSDPSLYVRKSAANHLNDISKDNPDWLLERLAAWDMKDARTAWIVRHALRTMIKKGDVRALKAMIASMSDAPQKLVVDYAVHYVKKSGSASRKMFKLRETDLPASSAQEFSISQAVRDFTTRKHHAGFHRVELMLNGEVLAESGFDLHI